MGQIYCSPGENNGRIDKIGLVGSCLKHLDLRTSYVLLSFVPFIRYVCYVSAGLQIQYSQNMMPKEDKLSSGRTCYSEYSTFNGQGIFRATANDTQMLSD